MSRNWAGIYDLIYTAEKDYASESADLVATIREHVPGAASLLDVGCGTGLHLSSLRHVYSEVVGIDVDPEMLTLAKARLGHDVALFEADMRTLNLDRTFDAVTCLFSVIGYVRDRLELNRTIERMAAHLRTPGLLIVDAWVHPDDWRDGPSVSVNNVSDDTRTVVRMINASRDGDVTHLVMHHLVGTDAGVEHTVDHHDLRLFTDDDYRSAFAFANLDVEVVRSPMPGRDRYIGVRRLTSRERSWELRRSGNPTPRTGSAGRGRPASMRIGTSEKASSAASHPRIHGPCGVVDVD